MMVKMMNAFDFESWNADFYRLDSLLWQQSFSWKQET